MTVVVVQRPALATGGVSGGGGVSVNNYLNTDGRGDRSSSVIGTTDATGLTNAEVGNMLDGVESIGNSTHAGDFGSGAAVVGKFIKFQFTTARNITEITFKQSTTASHGVWQFQGSNDDSSWTNVGSSFTLGGSLEQAIDVSGNTALYTYFRLHGVSGTSASAPWLQTFNFKIKEATKKTGTPSYSNYPGHGDMTGWATITSTASFGAGSVGLLFDYNTVNDVFWSGGQSSKEVKVQFPEAFVFSEMTFTQSNTSSHGTWIFEGSNDNSSWTSLSSSFTLGGSASQVVSMTVVPAGHTYVRMRQTAGTTSSSPYLHNFDFKCVRASHYAP